MLLEVAAHAKINLILAVFERRPDGLHNIGSLMQALELHDSLIISCESSSSSLPTSRTPQRPFSVQIECEGFDVPTNEDNLVYSAAKAVLEAANVAARVAIRIIKRIPVAAGLGGGSSDAAATILALNHLLDLGWGRDRCAQIGATLGSDGPFFFYQPAALVFGDGRDVKPVKLLSPQWVVLVKPALDISTSWAYKCLDQSRTDPVSNHGCLSAQSLRALLAMPMSIPTLYCHFDNDFQLVMEEQFPELRSLRNALIASGADVAMLSGSGSTVFGVYSHEATARVACKNIQSLHGHRAWVTKTQVIEPAIITDTTS